MKKITLLLILVLTTTLSFSQVSIGNGDDGSGFNTPPISPYYGYSYSQSIYLASEINTSGDITSIEYALNAGSDFSSADDNVDVWIGHTTKTAFDSTSDWVDVSTLNQVLTDGTVSVSGDILTITFSSSFAYNGTDNLVVAVDANEPGYGSSSSYVLSTNGPTAGLTLDQKSDSTNSDPTSPANGTLRQNRGNITFNGIIQSCPETSALTLDAVTNATATISWTAGGTETTWEYVVQAPGTGEPAAGGTSTTTNPLTVSGLTAATAYEIYIRAACDGGDFSAWVSTTFTTSCDSVTSFPYLESFENITTGQPVCWQVDGSLGSTSSYHFSSYVTGQSGRGMRFNSYNASSGETSELITPIMDASALSSLELNFQYKNPTGGDFEILISNDGGQNYTSLESGLTGQAVWAPKNYDLTSYISSTMLVKFKGTSNYGSGDAYIYLDEVGIREIPSCLEPTAITLDVVTNNTATISWTAGGTETTWEYVVEAYDSDSDEPTGTAYSTTSNPLSVTGLTANTLYDFYLRADCGGGDFSNWTKGSFSTECDVADGALFHNFDTLDNNDLVVDASCWSVVNQGDANTWGLVQNSTTNNIYWSIQYSSTAHDDYLYSPEITVLDGVTDAFNFKGWSYNAGYIESIDLLVVDATDNTVIATLESDLDLPYVADAADATRFTYDLSAYEGQDVKIGFHSETTNLYYAYLDEFTLDAFSTLGTATNILEGFALYPTIVKEELNFRSQNNVEAITVFNLLGQKVFSGAPNTNNSSINLSNLRPGMYVVKVSAEGKIGSYKIIKE